MNSLDSFYEQERVFNAVTINIAKALLYFVGSTYLFIQQIFVEYWKYSRHCATCCRYNGMERQKDHKPFLHRAYSNLVGELDTKNPINVKFIIVLCATTERNMMP